VEVIELGCGTAYFGAWLKKHGAARVVGVDITPAHPDGPAMNEQSFDLAFSEYGASIWGDPYRWIPKAARLLRPGGELAFICNTDMLQVCSPDEEKVAERLIRPGIGGSLSDA
jgi:ubiquinone/menaquinone biosynthesis C-methylase UbiE